MFKKMILLFLASTLAGCTYAGERELRDYINEPSTIVKDPHFANYQEKLDAVEKEYLEKKITYAQYLEQKTALDDQYNKEVKERNEKITGDEPVHGQ